MLIRIVSAPGGVNFVPSDSDSDSDKEWKDTDLDEDSDKEAYRGGLDAKQAQIQVKAFSSRWYTSHRRVPE